MPCQQMNTECLQRYVQARRSIDADIQIIEGLAGTLAQFEKLGLDHKMEIDPIKIGIIHHVIEQKIADIQANLDNFLALSKAEISLELRGNSKAS